MTLIKRLICKLRLFVSFYAAPPWSRSGHVPKLLMRLSTVVADRRIDVSIETGMEALYA